MNEKESSQYSCSVLSRKSIITATCEGATGRLTDGNMSSDDLAPALVQVAKDPRMNFTPEPFDVANGIVSNCLLAIGIRGSADIDDVDQSIRMSKVVQKLVS